MGSEKDGSAGNGTKGRPAPGDGTRAFAGARALIVSDETTTKTPRLSFRRAPNGPAGVGDVEALAAAIASAANEDDVFFAFADAAASLGVELPKWKAKKAGRAESWRANPRVSPSGFVRFPKSAPRTESGAAIAAGAPAGLEATIVANLSTEAVAVLAEDGEGRRVGRVLRPGRYAIAAGTALAGAAPAWREKLENGVWSIPIPYSYGEWPAMGTSFHMARVIVPTEEEFRLVGDDPERREFEGVRYARRADAKTLAFALDLADWDAADFEPWKRGKRTAEEAKRKTRRGWAGLAAFDGRLYVPEGDPRALGRAASP